MKNFFITTLIILGALFFLSAHRSNEIFTIYLVRHCEKENTCLSGWGLWDLWIWVDITGNSWKDVDLNLVDYLLISETDGRWRKKT